RILPLLALLVVVGCKENGPQRMGTSVNIAPTGIFQVIPATMDPNVSNLPAAVGTIVQNAGGGNAWVKGSDGIWVAFPGGGGSGQGIVDGGVLSPLSGNGSLASPLQINIPFWDSIQHARCVVELGTQTTDYDSTQLLHEYEYDRSIGLFAQQTSPIPQWGVVINGSGSSMLSFSGQKYGVGPVYPISNMKTVSYCVAARINFPIAPLAGSHFTEMGVYDVSGNNAVLFTMYTTDSTTVMHMYQQVGVSTTNTAGNSVCTLGSGMAVNGYYDLMLVWNANTTTLKAKVN